MCYREWGERDQNCIKQSYIVYEQAILLADSKKLEVINMVKLVMSYVVFFS